MFAFVFVKFSCICLDGTRNLNITQNKIVFIFKKYLNLKI